MIIHASKEFAKRFKCEVGGAGHVVLQTGRLDAWSAHCFKIGRKSAVFFMSDATLYSVIIATAGLRDFEAVFAAFLDRVAMKWRMEGVEFDPIDKSVILLPRSNRSLMSSMNEAIRCLTVHHQYVFDNDPDVDWSEYERMLNWMPYKAINHDSPQRVLREMLRPEG